MTGRVEKGRYTKILLVSFYVPTFSIEVKYITGCRIHQRFDTTSYDE